MPHVNKKPLARNENLIQTKNKAYNELWIDWENHLEKNPIQKIEKTVKIRVKLPHVNKKTTEKPNFCSNTVFSLYFKIRSKKVHACKTTRFFAPFPVSAWPKSLLQFDFKNHENVWTDLKKNIARRIPETTRSENLFNRHPTTHQEKTCLH